MKKLMMSALVVTSAFALAFVPASVNAQDAKSIQPTQPVQAIVVDDAGSWDYKGSEGETISKGSTRKLESVINSGGGSFMVRVIRNDGGGKLTVRLYETDSGTNFTGAHIGTKEVTGTGDAIFTNISNFVDGQDGNAEVWAEITNEGPSGYIGVTFHD